MSQVLKLLSLLSFIQIGIATYANAANSHWFEDEGARIRLLVDESVKDGNTVLGALEIDLARGWKTYWRDPGGSGVPPQVDISGSQNVISYHIGFPPPHRFDDGYSVYAGYSDPVAFALTFQIDDPDRPAVLNASIFLGVCEAICIPVQMNFSIEFMPVVASTSEVHAVAAAHSALPAPARKDFRIASWSVEGDQLLAIAEMDGNNTAELFLAGNSGWQFGTPVLKGHADGNPVFSIPIYARPKPGTVDEVEIDYTLVAGTTAVSGTLPLH